MNMKKYLGPALMGMALVLSSFVQVRAAESSAVGAADQNAAAVAKKVIPSVVRIEVQSQIVRRMATGVVMDKEGNIATTALTYPRGGQITVITLDGNRSEAEFVGFDVETQLAVVRAKDKKILSPLPAGKADDIAPGMWVCVVGVSPENTPSVTQGIISSYANGRLRLNVWVTPGTSGGAVIDENGRLVGLLRGIYTEDRPVVFSYRDKQQTGLGYVVSQAEAPSSGMALAVPVDVVMNVFSQIRDKGRVSRAWLGVGVIQTEDGRLIVDEVDEKSPAAAANLREGDVIVSMDNKEATGGAAVGSAIRNKKPGEQVTFGIVRDGKNMDVKVKLGEYTQDVAIQEMETRFPKLFRIEPPMPPDGKIRPPQRPGMPFQAFGKNRSLGFYCDELSRELAGHFGVKEGRALIISKLAEGGPAEKAGLKIGDVIIKVDGDRIETRDQLIDAMQGKDKGQKVKIGLLRDRREMTREIEMTEDRNGPFLESGNLGDLLGPFIEFSESLGMAPGNWTDDESISFGRDMKSAGQDLADESAAVNKASKKDHTANTTVKKRKV